MNGVEIEYLKSIPIDYELNPTYDDLLGGWMDDINRFLAYPECRETLTPERIATTPIKGKHAVRFGCLHLYKDLTDNQVLRMMMKKKVLPATGREALDFGRQVYRFGDFTHPMIARGSSYERKNLVSYGTLLHRRRKTSEGNRVFDIFDFSHTVNLVWLQPCHFLVLLPRSYASA